MSTRAIAVDKEQVVNTDTYVSSALTFPVQTYLPKINDGSGGSVAVDAIIRVETTAGGTVELLTQGGRRVGIVPSRRQAVVVARTGTVGRARRLELPRQTADSCGRRCCCSCWWHWCCRWSLRHRRKPRHDDYTGQRDANLFDRQRLDES